MTERQLIFAANWKMNHGPSEARAFAYIPAAQCSGRRARLGFFPPAVSIGASAEAMRTYRM